MADETQAGVNFIGSLTDMERKNDAYNALNHAYGPAIAYDPTNAFNAARASVAQQTIPTQVQQEQENLKGTQLTNQSTAASNQTMAGARAAALLATQANEDGSIPQDAYDRIIRPNAGVLGIDPDHVDSFGQMLSQPGGVQHLQRVQQALMAGQPIAGAPIQVLNPDGTTSLVMHTKTGGIVQQNLNGTTAPIINAQTGQGKLAETGRHNRIMEPIAQQNANSNAFRANTAANNSEFGNPNGTLPQRGTAPAAAPASGPAAKSHPAIPPDSLFAKLPPKGKQEAIGQATQIVNQGTNLASTNKILDSVMGQINPYTAGTGSLLKDLPGTAQTDLKANLKTLQAQGLTSWISSLKNGKGQTGIGRVLQSEANAAMTLFGNMEQDQSAKQLAFHAQLFRTTVNRLYQHAQEGFHTMYGVDAHSALGETPAAAPGAALPSGWSYLGAAKQ